MRPALVIALVATASVSHPPAYAATLRLHAYPYDLAYFTAWPREVNSLILTYRKGAWLFADRRARVHAGHRCVQVHDSAGQCRGDMFASVRLRDGDDEAIVRGRVPAEAYLYGGLGGDHLASRISKNSERAFLYGGEGDDRLDGGDGPEKLQGGAGNDRLSGGAGDDWLAGEAGADVLHGGRGIDTVYYDSSSEGVVVTLSGLRDDGPRTGVKDVLGSDIENVYGSMHDDDISGTAGKNELLGKDGRDSLRGLAGADDLGIKGGTGSSADGGNGPDRIEAESNSALAGEPQTDYIDGGNGNDSVDVFNGSPDSVQCGPGIDRVSADDLDVVRADCERVTVHAAAAVASDQRLNAARLGERLQPDHSRFRSNPRPLIVLRGSAGTTRPGLTPSHRRSAAPPRPRSTAPAPATRSRRATARCARAARARSRGSRSRRPACRRGPRPARASR